MSDGPAPKLDVCRNFPLTKISPLTLSPNKIPLPPYLCWGTPPPRSEQPQRVWRLGRGPGTGTKEQGGGLGHGPLRPPHGAIFFPPRFPLRPPLRCVPPRNHGLMHLGVLVAEWPSRAPFLRDRRITGSVLAHQGGGGHIPPPPVRPTATLAATRIVPVELSISYLMCGLAVQTNNILQWDVSMHGKVEQGGKPETVSCTITSR